VPTLFSVYIHTHIYIYIYIYTCAYSISISTFSMIIPRFQHTPCLCAPYYYLNNNYYNRAVIYPMTRRTATTSRVFSVFSRRIIINFNCPVETNKRCFCCCQLPRISRILILPPPIYHPIYSKRVEVETIIVPTSIM
jgi:hypothetical protein